MGRIDKVLLREIDLKATAVRNDPNYYLKRAHKIQHALSNSAKIYSWWIEHPELRRIIIGKIDTQKKAHLIGIMKRGVGNLLISWDYIRMQKNIFSSTTLLNLAQKVDPEQNVGYRTIHALLGRQDKNLGKQRAFFDYVGGKVNCALDWVLNDLHLGSFRYNYHH